MKKRILAILLCIGIVLSMTAMTTDGTEETGAVSEVQSVSTEAAASAADFTPQVVGTQTDDIEVHLFNYGNQINEAGALGFRGQGYASNLTSEIDGVFTDSCYGHQEYAYLKDLDADGYPMIDRWVNANGATVCTDMTDASLKYLFDKSLTDAGTAPTSYNYTIKHYPVSTVKLFSYDESTRYYSYDSRYNAAVYDYDTNALNAYNYALRPAQMEQRVRNQGAFIPFNQAVFGTNTNVVQLTDASGNQAYTSLSGVSGLHEPKNTGSSSDNMYGGTIGSHVQTVGKKNPADYGIDPNTVYYNNFQGYGPADLYKLKGDVSNLFALQSGAANYADLAFGMSVEFSFLMPKDGKVNGSDMVFEFIGDDDLMVYIDEKPALNLAGHHEATKGTINFATGEVVIYESGKSWEDSQVRDSAAVDQGNGKSLYLDKDLSEVFGWNDDQVTFEDYTIHTLKIFYMERVGGASNCVIKFNLPVIPRGNVSVEKEVEGINSALTDDQTYNFTISAAHGSEDVSTISYDRYDAATDTTTKNLTVENNGTFQLKDGQRANFNLPDGAEVTFTEQANAATGSTSWTKDGTAVSGSITATVNENNLVAFVCTNTRETGALKISKELIGTLPEGAADTYTINVNIAGKPYTGVGKYSDGSDAVFNEDGQTTLPAGQSVTIESIPTGMEYLVTEETPTSSNSTVYEYAAPAYTNNQGTVSAGTTTVKVSNTVNFKNGDLTIVKEGIDALDHHEEDTVGNKEEQQSTIYVVKGISEGCEDIELEVVIVGNDSVKIAGLPIGTYTITEKTDWAWRYSLTVISAATDIDAEVVPAEAKITFELTAAGEIVTFMNSRNITKWLSGDNYEGNHFYSSNRVGN